MVSAILCMNSIRSRYCSLRQSPQLCCAQLAPLVHLPRASGYHPHPSTYDDIDVSRTGNLGTLHAPLLSHGCCRNHRRRPGCTSLGTEARAACCLQDFQELLGPTESRLLGPRARSASDAAVLRRKGHLKEQVPPAATMQSM